MTFNGLWSVAPHALMGIVQDVVCRGWQIAARLARQFTRHRSHQRRGKRRSASHTQHAGPTVLPRECDLVGQETGGFACFCLSRHIVSTAFETRIDIREVGGERTNLTNGADRRDVHKTGDGVGRRVPDRTSRRCATSSALQPPGDRSSKRTRQVTPSLPRDWASSPK